MKKLTLLAAFILFQFLYSCHEEPHLPDSDNYQKAVELMKSDELTKFETVSDFIIFNSSDPSELAHIYYLRGFVKYSQDSLEQAYHDFKHAHKYFQTLDDILNMARINNWLGQVFFEIESYANALFHFEEALKYARMTGIDKHIINGLYGMGKTCKRLAKYELSLKYFFEARTMAQEIQNLKKFLNIQLEIGIVQYLVGNYKFALEHNWSVMNSATGTVYENLFKGKAYNNLGDIYIELGDYQKAEKYLTLSLNFTDRGDIYLAATYNNLGRLQNKLGNYLLASSYFQKSVKLNQTKIDLEEISVAYKHICSVPHIKANADSLLHYMSQFTQTVSPILAARKRLEKNDLRHKLDSYELVENRKAERKHLPIWAYLIIVVTFILVTAFLILQAKFRLLRRSQDIHQAYQAHKKSIQYYTKELEATKRKLRDY